MCSERKEKQRHAYREVIFAPCDQWEWLWQFDWDLDSHLAALTCTENPHNCSNNLNDIDWMGLGYVVAGVCVHFRDLPFVRLSVWISLVEFSKCEHLTFSEVVIVLLSEGFFVFVLHAAHYLAKGHGGIMVKLSKWSPVYYAWKGKILNLLFSHFLRKMQVIAFPY